MEPMRPGSQPSSGVLPARHGATPATAITPIAVAEAVDGRKVHRMKKATADR